jgi:hypothetical protein
VVNRQLVAKVDVYFLTLESRLIAGHDLRIAAMSPVSTVGFLILTGGFMMNSAAGTLVDPLAVEWIESLRDRMLALRQSALDLESRAADQIAQVHPERREAARNLVDYLAVRQADIRDLHCAHDGPEAWDAMVRHLEAARIKLGRECLVAFDLAGPELRTGPLQPGSEVLRFKPGRDKFDVTVAPAPILFGPAATIDDDELSIVPVDPALHDLAGIGDEVTLKDTRGRNRVLPILDIRKRAFLPFDGNGTRVKALR